MEQPPRQAPSLHSRPWAVLGPVPGSSCPCLPVSSQAYGSGPRELWMWPTGSPLGSRATQMSPEPGLALILLCHLLWCLAGKCQSGELGNYVEETTETELSKLHPDLTVGPVLLWNAWGLT